MPAGLQLFDGAARVYLDTNYRVAKLLGVVNPGLGNTVVNDARLTQGIPFAFYRMDGDGFLFGFADVSPQMTVPSMGFSGTTLTITRSAPPGTGQTYPCTVYYGIR